MGNVPEHMKVHCKTEVRYSVKLILTQLPLIT